MTLDMSIIIPTCNEMPQLMFTVQSVIEELEGYCEYEIIVVDNRSDDDLLCTAATRSVPTKNNYFTESFDKGKLECYQRPRTFPLAQRRKFYNAEKDKTMGTWFFRKGKVKYLRYDDRLGHWQAKNHGIEHAKGDTLFFLDAHCVMKRDSLRKMHSWLVNSKDQVGGIHALICYMLDSHPLEYRVQEKFFGYQFCSAQKGRTEPYQVCVMSTCAMLTPRSAIDTLGGWSRELGIYGGGESYINWKQSTCGWGHWIHPEAWCWHFADKRGYSWNHTDFVRNSFIAAYVVGGDKWLDGQVEQRIHKDRPATLHEIADNVRTTCADDRAFTEAHQVTTFDEYIQHWKANPGHF